MSRVSTQSRKKKSRNNYCYKKTMFQPTNTSKPVYG